MFGAALAVSIRAQQSNGRTVEAEAFVLRGPAGEELARLANLNNGPALQLNDKEGRLRVSVHVSSSGATYFQLFDTNKTARLGIEVSKEGEPTIDMEDAAGQTRMNVMVDNNQPAIAMFDGNGMSRAEIQVDDKGPFVRLLDEKGKNRLVLALLPDSSFVRLYDVSGKQRATIGSNNGGGGEVTLYDKAQKVTFKKPD
jgi:hypothetical protein